MPMIPFSCLPEDAASRARLLKTTFRDHCVESTRTQDGWAVSLRRPDQAAFYIDPRLQEGLTWWAQGTRVCDIPLAVRRENGWQLSLSDAWSVYAWSVWLEACAAQQAIPKEVVILHIDSHSDLLSPHLWQVDDGWVDALTGNPVDMLVPATVADAIASGAIDIATYIAPLVHAIPNVHIRYLRPIVPEVNYFGMYQLNPIVAQEQFLATSGSRLKLQYKRIERNEQVTPSSSTLKVSHDLNDFLTDLPDVPLLLHIDCDYFNNRYDGNHNWQAVPQLHDPKNAEIIHRIDALFDALLLHGLTGRIVDISVALSPKFFPAELWPLATMQLRKHIEERQLSNRENIFKHLGK